MNIFKISYKNNINFNFLYMNYNNFKKQLIKLDQASTVVPMDVNPLASHLFIVNPLSAQRLMKIFSTHQTIEDRVRRLQSSNL